MQSSLEDQGRIKATGVLQMTMCKREETSGGKVKEKAAKAAEQMRNVRPATLPEPS
jgi:hypothetical protein